MVEGTQDCLCVYLANQTMMAKWSKLLFFFFRCSHIKGKKKCTALW